MLEKVAVGADVEVSFNLSSREFNGKYYHNIDAWKIDAVDGTSNAEEPPPPEDPGPDDDDVPF